MSDGISDAYRSMERDRECRARLDAACFALATYLGLDTTGREDYRDPDDWNRVGRPRPLGLVRVVVNFRDGYEITQAIIEEAAALERKDPSAWQPVLETIKETLGLEPASLIVADSMKPTYDYEAWARWLAAVVDTEWEDTVLAASPFAGMDIVYVRRELVNDGSHNYRLLLTPGANARAIKYLEALARRDGHAVTVEYRWAPAGPVTTSVTVLALPPIVE